MTMYGFNQYLGWYNLMKLLIKFNIDANLINLGVNVTPEPPHIYTVYLRSP